MTYTPVPPLEIFAECLAVPPLQHVAAIGDVRILTVGQFALPLAKLALRYPSTVDVRMIGMDPTKLPADRRVSGVRSREALPADWQAHVIGVAVPGDPSRLLQELAPHLAPSGVIVVAVDQVKHSRQIKNTLGQIYTQVLPYRECAPEPTIFLLASNRRFGTPRRPWPPNLRHLNPRYLQSLFSLPQKDYRLLYGPEKP